MNPNIKAKWVAALRSGEYKQGRHSLKIRSDYCCLGVLCELAVMEGVIPPPIKNEEGQWSYVDKKGTDNCVLIPTVVRDWAGLHSHAPLTTRGSLVGLNDTDRLSFDQIADIIEKDL